MTYASAFEDPYTAFEESTVMLDDLLAILFETIEFRERIDAYSGKFVPSTSTS